MLGVKNEQEKDYGERTESINAFFMVLLPIVWVKFFAESSQFFLWARITVNQWSVLAVLDLMCLRWYCQCCCRIWIAFIMGSLFATRGISQSIRSRVGSAPRRRFPISIISCFTDGKNHFCVAFLVCQIRWFFGHSVWSRLKLWRF